MPTKKTVKKATSKKSQSFKQDRDFKALFYRKLTETHLFFEVGRIIASELEPVDLVKKIVAAVGKAIPFEDASVYVVKKDMTGLDPLYHRQSCLRNIQPGTIYFDNGAPGQIAASGEPLFLDDTRLFESFLHHPDEDKQVGSYLGIPLKNENRIVGVMGFSNSVVSTYRVEEFDLLRTLSHIISAGIEKADLFKKTLELARVDELTGMLNYRVLLEKLEEEVNRQVRTGREFSFVMVDIDDFKKVNDRYGHLEGSRLIAQMGPLLKAACRTTSTDTCFRYGGEEFSVLLAETDMQEALAVAERVRKAVEEYPFTVKVLHPSDRITVSLGVSSMVSDTGKTIAQLMNEADLALYTSKALGKNRVTCFSPECGMPGTSRNQGS
jgi:diguanylate cyclase (GGDEF)-like protein